MASDDRFVLTDLPSEVDYDGLVTPRVHRCRGCAGCISTNMGTCVIQDSFTGLIELIMSVPILEIHTSISDGQFAMPMRKAVERLSNVFQAYTDAGHNDHPLDSDSVELRRIEVVVRGKKVAGFEDYARELLQMGPVESMGFSYQ